MVGWVPPGARKLLGRSDAAASNCCMNASSSCTKKNASTRDCATYSPCSLMKMYPQKVMKMHRIAGKTIEVQGSHDESHKLSQESDASLSEFNHLIWFLPQVPTKRLVEASKFFHVFPTSDFLYSSKFQLQCPQMTGSPRSLICSLMLLSVPTVCQAAAGLVVGRGSSNEVTD